jgi:4-aminobutyrate aminotransferase/(S)-3-amino-2-methylpropionate transaminase
MKDFAIECAAIGDIRGMGAMIGIEFVKNRDHKQPDGELCSKIVKGCAEEGLVLLSAGMYKNVIRILSPIVISDEQLNTGLDILIQQIKKHTSA